MAAVLVGVAIRSHPEHAQIEQTEHRGADPGAVERVAAEIAAHRGAPADQRPRELLHVLVLLQVALDPPVRVVQVLPPTGHVGPDRLQVTVRQRADPHVRPGWRDDQVLDPHDVELGQRLAGVVQVAEPTATPQPSPSRHRGADPTQPHHGMKVVATRPTRRSPIYDGGMADVEVLSTREVPLGGLRAMTVRRTLPQRHRSFVGAWCFADHYGPDDVAGSGGMDLPPHPHTGLQTVSWLFAGRAGAPRQRRQHRHGAARRDEPDDRRLGICHSEVSTDATSVLHGVQLWVALPDEHRHTPRDFQHHVTEPVALDGATVRVFLGSLARFDLAGPHLHSPAGRGDHRGSRARRSRWTSTPTFEHGVLLDTASARGRGGQHRARRDGLPAHLARRA